MTRDRLALVLLATALSAAACAAPSIDSIEDEIVVPARVSGASGSDDEADPNAPAGSGSNTGSTKSADTTGAPTSTGGASTPPPPPPPVGKWMQANGQDCVAFCTQAGKTNVASSDGAKCTSGENIPASAIAAGITYDKCFPSCSAHVSNNGSPVSDGKYCYSNGQKHDDDASDVTRGCFCK